MALFLFILTGAIAGTMAGLLGVGGGIIVVPGLALVFTSSDFPKHIIMHLAEGSSLAAMVFTAISSTYSHHSRRSVIWPLFWQFFPGIILGTFLGAFIADHLSTHVLRILFSITLLIIALRMFRVTSETHSQLPGTYWLILTGLIIGISSGLLGIGGALLTVPFLTHWNVPIRRAAGTASALGLPISITGTISYMFTGFNETGLPTLSTGFVYWPAVLAIALTSMLFVYVGSFLSLRLSVKRIRRIFAYVLVIVAVRLAIG